MHKIEAGAAHVIAGDLRSTFDALDDAIASGTRLFSSVVDTARSSDLNVTESQRLYDPVAASLMSVVKGRADMVEAVKRMSVLKRASNLEPVDLGCANPLKVFTEASAASELRPCAAQ